MHNNKRTDPTPLPTSTQPPSDAARQAQFATFLVRFKRFLYRCRRLADIWQGSMMVSTLQVDRDEPILPFLPLPPADASARELPGVLCERCCVCRSGSQHSASISCYFDAYLSISVFFSSFISLELNRCICRFQPLIQQFVTVLADRSSNLTASSLFLSSCRSAHFLLSLLDFCTAAVDPPVRVAFHGRMRFAWPSVDSVFLVVDVDATGVACCCSSASDMMCE